MNGPDAPLCILDVTKYYGDTTGGVRTYLDQKSAWISRHPPHRHVLAVPAERSAVHESGAVRRHELAGPRIPTQPPYRFLLSAAALRRIVLREAPDLIEIGSPFLVPWVVREAIRGLDLPLTWFYHGNVPRLISRRPDGEGRVRGVRHRAGWTYVRAVSRLVRATFAASDFVAAELEREGVANVRRVRLGVDLDRFTPARRGSREAVRAARGLPRGALAIFAGRLAREKHLDVVLRGWEPVERETGAALAIVGDGPSREWLRRRPGAERVHWLPFERDRDALADLLAAADLYIAPGPSETFGLAALEALASGTPVLSVASGGVPELVTRSGAGAVYPVGDAPALAAAAVRLLQGDLAALGRLARAYAEREHDWDGVFADLFAIYHSLAR